MTPNGHKRVITVLGLVARIEAAGYALEGKDGLPDDVAAAVVLAAPLVLLPAGPVDENRFVFVDNFLDAEDLPLGGFARIEGAIMAANATRPVVVRVLFTALETPPTGGQGEPSA